MFGDPQVECIMEVLNAYLFLLISLQGKITVWEKPTAERQMLCEGKMSLLWFSTGENVNLCSSSTSSGTFSQ